MAENNKNKFNLDKSNNKFDLSKGEAAAPIAAKKSLWWLLILIVIFMLIGVSYFYGTVNQQADNDVQIAEAESHTKENHIDLSVKNLTELGDNLPVSEKDADQTDEQVTDNQDQQLSNIDLLTDDNQYNALIEDDRLIVSNSGDAEEKHDNEDNVKQAPENITREVENNSYVKGKKYEIYYFPFNESDYTNSNPELERLVLYMKADASKKIQIDAYTDSDGSVEYNKALSDERASAIKEYLIENGIDAERIQNKGMGISYAYDNEDESGRSKNRRAEFILTN